jgi:hypothetical protein
MFNMIEVREFHMGTLAEVKDSSSVISSSTSSNDEIAALILEELRLQIEHARTVYMVGGPWVRRKGMYRRMLWLEEQHEKLRLKMRRR